MEKKLSTGDEGQFYKGTLKNREVIETENSIVVLDIRYGKHIISEKPIADTMENEWKVVEMTENTTSMNPTPTAPATSSFPFLLAGITTSGFPVFSFT